MIFSTPATQMGHRPQNAKDKSNSHAEPQVPQGRLGDCHRGEHSVPSINGSWRAGSPGGGCRSHLAGRLGEAHTESPRPGSAADPGALPWPPPLWAGLILPADMSATPRALPSPPRCFTEAHYLSTGWPTGSLLLAPNTGPTQSSQHAYPSYYPPVTKRS